LHRFRKRAEDKAASLTRTAAVQTQAYTDGVNAGLQALNQYPFEYLVLGNEPRLWQPADTVLVVFAMYLDLQDETAQYEATLNTLYQHLPARVAAFFAPLGTLWDAPLQGKPMAAAPVPEKALFDLRYLSRDLSILPLEASNTIALGSNNWAVSGRRSKNGAALLANDMHLGLRVPNIWYRARLVYKDQDLRKTGIYVACVRGVDGPEGRRQAYRDVFTAASGTSCVSPDRIAYSA
jgi:penicillin amidase